MNNVMVHLTRLDNRPSAMIVEIAAVFFDLKTGVIGADFHEVISPEKQDRLGTATAAFNSQWGHYLRTNYPDDEDLGTDIVFALDSFVDWLCQIEVMADRVMWSTGDDFSDCGLLHQLILDYMGKNPEHRTGRFWRADKVNDIQTLFNLIGYTQEPNFPAIHATDIVKLKAKAVSDIKQALKL